MSTPSSTDRPLILGGVEIPHRQGLLGHSDADVLLHAICDALLGAAALGDIGRHFPDSDPAYEGISSLDCWPKRTLDLLRTGLSGAQHRHHGGRPATATGRPHPADGGKDCPGHGSSPDRVNVKATTTERLGFTGRSEGIAAYAVVLLEETPA